MILSLQAGFGLNCFIFLALSCTSALLFTRNLIAKLVNRVIGVYLRCLSRDRPKEWLCWLPWAEFCYNSSFQTALRATPFKVVYGQDPPTLVAYETGVAHIATVDRQLLGHDKFLAKIKERLLQAQVYMKGQYDEAMSIIGASSLMWANGFGCGFIRGQRHLLERSPMGKFSPRFFGPYKIVQHVGTVAYRLQPPVRACIHDVFHVALLKLFHGELPVEMVPLPYIHHGHVVPIFAPALHRAVGRC